MTLNGQVLIVAFVAAKGSIFPDADLDAPIVFSSNCEGDSAAIAP
jgi:hypothetical protein